MNKTIEYLRKKEWSMGNGQCPDCCGLSDKLKRWYWYTDYQICTDYMNPHSDKVKNFDEWNKEYPQDLSAHKVGCILAECLEELGEKVQYCKSVF